MGANKCYGCVMVSSTIEYNAAYDVSAPEERARLSALYDYKILDTAAERAFDRLTQLASNFYQSPVALMTLVDEERKWFKSRIGVDGTEIPRQIAFCHHAIQSDRPFIVNNAATDPQFKQNPLVTGPPNIRFYAGAPLITPSGYRIGTICIIDTTAREDFTEKDAVQLQLLAEIAISEMELRVRNDELKVSNASIERATEAKKDFLAMMSHEIRNPLTAILSIAQSLNEVDIPDSHKDLIPSLQASGQILMGLLNDLLDLEKLNVGKIELHLRNVALKPFLRNMYNIWQQVAQEKGLQLNTEINGNLPEYAFIDELRLTQICNNLLSNAIKFTQEGSVDVRITIPEKMTASDRCCVFIDVIDTGIGMSEAQIERLFKPFEQATSQIAGQYGGTGLGMAITKNLVTMMEGSIMCESILGQGTKFKVTIPISTNEESETAVKNIEEDLPPVGLHILIVDDSKINLTVATHLVKSLGHIVDTAGNGQEAVRMVMNAQYDLVLMDKYMPQMDGLEASKAMISVQPHQKIVLVSADDQLETSQVARDCGMIDAIAKPISVDNLMRVVQRHIGSK